MTLKNTIQDLNIIKCISTPQFNVFVFTEKITLIVWV